MIGVMLIADYKGALMTARNKNSSSGTCGIISFSYPKKFWNYLKFDKVLFDQ